MPPRAIMFPAWHTTILEAAIRTARTEIVASELFHQLFVAMYDLVATFYLAFGWVSFATLTAALESSAIRYFDLSSWSFSFLRWCEQTGVNERADSRRRMDGLRTATAHAKRRRSRCEWNRKIAA